MNAARRSSKRRDWPRGLREPRPGYYCWEQPGGKLLVIGRVPFAVARNEALAANSHIAATKPTLLDKLAGAGRTLADLLARMPVSPKANTAKSSRSLDKIIRAKLGAKAVADLTVADCAELLAPIIEAQKARSAQAVRSRLVAVLEEGRALGWIKDNPASVTRNPKVTVQRGRLTLEAFRLVYEAAPQVSEWLQHAMALALVTGADRATVAALERSDAGDGYLTVARGKTGVCIAIPLRLRLDAMGWTLGDLVEKRGIVGASLLVHHISPWGNAPAGSKIHPDRISHAFTDARKMAGIPDEAAPTFHELRSLAKRLYEAQGGVDTKALLGHKTERMADLYANPRGVEAVRVRVA